MRILVVNVNTTESITQAIARQAQSVASPGTEIIGLTPHFGADSIEGNFESYLAAIAVMDRVMSYDQPFDAVIQAGYGEHGREGLQELLNVPVVDITDAGASTAMFLGHAYSVVTTLDRTVPLIEDRLKLSGLWDRCASVRASGLAVLELESDPERALEAIVRQAELAVLEDKAEVICLGCGGMAGLDEQIRQRTGVPVVDGVTAAVTIAESLVRLGLSTSKVRGHMRRLGRRTLLVGRSPADRRADRVHDSPAPSGPDDGSVSRHGRYQDPSESALRDDDCDRARAPSDRGAEMHRVIATLTATAAAATAAAGVVLSPSVATASPVDLRPAHGVVVAKGGLVRHVRPSTHAPANYTFPNGSEVTLDCKVSGTVVDGIGVGTSWSPKATPTGCRPAMSTTSGRPPSPATRATAPSRRGRPPC